MKTSEEQIIGIYHSRDLDGIASGAIIKAMYPNAIMIGYHYGEPLTLPVLGIPVIMADVSLPFDKMVKVAEESGSQFTWIDHHKSSIDEFNVNVGAGPAPYIAYTQVGVGACELTYKLLNQTTDAPIGIKLLSKYDVWDKSDEMLWQEKIMPFQYGMRAICNSISSFPMDLLLPFCSSVDKIISDGHVVLNYQDIQNEKDVMHGAFESYFEGYRAIFMNTTQMNSQAFISIYDELKHDLMIPFNFNGKFWTFSIYTTKDIDCSVLAKKYGGGGHAKAAWFQPRTVDEVKKVLSMMQ